MPINVEGLDRLIFIHTKSKEVAEEQIENLTFVKDKILNGTVDEKKLIFIVGKLTLDSLNETVKIIRDQMENFK